MMKCRRDIRYRHLPYLSLSLLVVALIVCTTTEHAPLVLVAHSALVFVAVLLCIYHYKSHENGDAIAQAHLPYATTFFLYGVVIGGHNTDALAAVVVTVLALIATGAFYTHEALREYAGKPLAPAGNIDLGPMHEQGIGGLEE